MKTCTREQYAEAIASDKYCHWGRWEYYQVAKEALTGVDGTGLGIGPHTCPLLRDGVYIDRRRVEGSPSPLIILDLAKNEIPFAQNEFSVCVALEVLEHLPNTAGVLRKLATVAQRVVVSIPWNWTSGDRQHMQCGEAWWKRVLEQAGNVREEARELVPSNTGREHMVFRVANKGLAEWEDAK